MSIQLQADVSQPQGSLGGPRPVPEELYMEVPGHYNSTQCKTATSVTV